MFDLGNGMPQKSYEPHCRTEGMDKVFFREMANREELKISMTETNLKKNLNLQLMIRHLPEKIEPETVVTTTITTTPKQQQQQQQKQQQLQKQQQQQQQQQH